MRQHEALTLLLQFAERRSEFDAGGDIVLCMTQLNLSAQSTPRMFERFHGVRGMHCH